MRLTAPLLLPAILGATFRHRSSQQDGYEKTMAPWISTGNEKGIQLIPQMEISQEGGQGRRGERSGRIGDEKEGNPVGSERKRSKGGGGKRGLKWVQQAEYSGQTFFDR